MSKKTVSSFAAAAALALCAVTACTAQEAPDRDRVVVEVSPPDPQGDSVDPNPDGEANMCKQPSEFEGWRYVDCGVLSNTARKIPENLFCPEYGSRAATGALKDAVIDKNRSEPILAMSGGATVRVMPGVTVSGDIVVCGGGARLILQGTVTGKVLLSGGGPTLLLVDGVAAPAATWIRGGGPEIVECSENAGTCQRYF